MQVIRWTYWSDETYPDAEPDEEMEKVYEEAIVQAIREHGYRFSGPAHQHHPYTVPVMSDGVRYACGFRRWGMIMAKALNIPGDHAYLVWAFDMSEGQEPKYPKPEDWGETETEDHMKGYALMEDQFLAQELGRLDRAGHPLFGKGAFVAERMWVPRTENSENDEP